MDRHAEFLKLFVAHQGDLKAFLASVVRDRSVLQDLFQETSLVLWQKYGEYDSGRSFGAWARGIAANKILQERSRRIPLAFSPAAIRGILEAYDRSEPLREDPGPLRDCVSRLPERSRRLLALRYESALKLGEIARRVGTTLDAVHKTLSRIREILEDCLRRKAAAE
ncbi:MAG TPA: sigma-70 family RNA polymerase sigma factor [Planctomycetota bacterium]